MSHPQQQKWPNPKPDLENTNNGDPLSAQQAQLVSEDFESTCSTPYVSAPSSPSRGPINGGFFYSCPASPMHFAITTIASSYSASAVSSPDNGGSVPIGYEFEFFSRLGSVGSGQPRSMSFADELFLNGQIHPMKLSSHLERPQVLAPLLDLENEEEEEEIEISKRGRDLRLREKSLGRRTRSMSPLRSNCPFEFGNENEENKKANQIYDSIRGLITRRMRYAFDRWEEWGWVG